MDYDFTNEEVDIFLSSNEELDRLHCEIERLKAENARLTNALSQIGHFTSKRGSDFEKFIAIKAFARKKLKEGK